MPELRKDPVIGRWVIIATERAKRPDEFKHDKIVPKGGFCPFCSGNEDKTPPEVLAYRTPESHANGKGWRVRVVPNKFPALMIEGGLNREGDGVYDKMNGVGAHEVIVETPDHSKSLCDLTAKEVEEVLWAFRDRILDLRKDTRFKYILLFKNHGAAAGASLEHTHSQLIALPVVPRTVHSEMYGAREYYNFKERCVFCDVVRQELEAGKRLILENADFAVISPYAPRFPFETWILPKVHDAHFEDCKTNEYANLAAALRTTLRRLNIALNNPPYNFILHTLPLTEKSSPYYHWHIEIMPILTRVAGFEWGSGFYINPTPPEDAAEFLRGLASED
ncbi:MAG: galactose-1-phosphate uridylyltransferase [Deltaproteobacteria bacterium]|nr:galactose-1-phosphate uridylyltransferase [Deltaproteobacteria bacterium]